VLGTLTVRITSTGNKAISLNLVQIGMGPAHRVEIDAALVVDLQHALEPLPYCSTSAARDFPVRSVTVTAMFCPFFADASTSVSSHGSR
jgi:hypothetical protein